MIAEATPFHPPFAKGDFDAPGKIVAENWFLREYREGDEKGIIELHRQVFGSEVDPDWWRWRYLRSPTADAVIMVAESRGRIVGQYALVPLRMKVGNEECLGSLSLDTMVHPDFRGVGMFTKLAEGAYAAAVGRGIRFVYGFPNANSHHGFVAKLGWRDLQDGIPLWARPLNIPSIIRKRFGGSERMAALAGWPVRMAMGIFYRPRKATGRCAVREIRRFDERFDALWKEASGRYNIALIRDREYLERRYSDRPGAPYIVLAAEEGEKLLGCAVLHCMPRFGLQIGFVMELMVTPGRAEVARDLIGEAFARFRAEGADIAGALMPPGHAEARFLRQMGFIRVPKRMLPQDMFWGVRDLSFGGESPLVTDPANWYISWGDHDSV